MGHVCVFAQWAVTIPVKNTISSTRNIVPGRKRILVPRTARRRGGRDKCFGMRANRRENGYGGVVRRRQETTMPD